MEKKMNQLPDEVAKHYKVEKGKPFKFHHRRYGYVDLNTINLKQAKAMEKELEGHLVPVSKISGSDSPAKTTATK